jgi:hypothetical protein
MKLLDIFPTGSVYIIEQHFIKTDKLVESVCYDLTIGQRTIVEGIYKECRPLIEATLTVDQIQKLFTNIESEVTAAGGNRTAIGKGKDVLGKANEIINNVGKWLQDTTPVQAFDQKFDQLKNTINQKFPDSKITSGIAKLGSWAKENPGKTAAIIGVLTAVAALGGGPLGGAIAGQVLRGSSELLKGEKLSTAIGKGAKAAALGGLAGEAFEVINQAFGSGAQVIADKLFPGAQSIRLMKNATGLGFQEVRAVGKPEDIAEIRKYWEAAGDAWKNDNIQQANQLLSKAKEVAAKMASPEYAQAVVDNREARNSMVDGARSVISAIDKIGAATQGAVTATSGSKKENYEISRHQIDLIFEYCDLYATILTEGPLDVVKGALKKGASAVAQKTQQVGKNLTTKVTADKLTAAWKKAGSPTDSNAVADVLRKAGVNDTALSTAFKAARIKLPPAKSTSNTSQPASIGATKPNNVAVGSNLKFDELKAAVSKLRSRDAQSLIAYLDTLDGKPAPAKSATSNVIGSMANQLAGNKPNTMANAPASVRNTPKPGNPNLQTTTPAGTTK